ncbi:Essential protein Yae1, N terminal [Orbilia oligospora]|nr:Essential protein Yae1, N terminal [Orbilia oligospora]
MAIHSSSVQNPAYDDDYYDTSTPHPSSTLHLASKHTTEGYRDGITASKQQFIQEGFDEGYILGAALGLKVGELLGTLEGIVGTIYGLLNSLDKNQKKDVDSKSSEDREVLKEQLRRQKKVRETAKQELALEKVFGKDYFGEDGVWKWTAEEEDGEMTFDDIVLQHPLIVKWRDIVKKQAEELGLDIKDDVEAQEERSADDDS